MRPLQLETPSATRAIAVTVLLALAAPGVTAQEAGPGPGEPGSARVLVLEHVTVLPMDRNVSLSQQTVVVRDGHIEAIVPAADAVVPEDALRIDALGLTLLPGLIDVHVHLIDEGELVTYLAHGVTTVRNLMGVSAHLELRERVASGEVLGPRILTSGPFVNLPQVATPDQARAAAVEQAAAGYDCVKVHGPLSRDAYVALLEAAGEVGLPVVGHAPRNLEMELVLSLGGQADVSHAEEYLYTYFDRDDVDADAGAMEAIAAATAAAGVSVVPNLVAYGLIVDQIRDLDGFLASPELAWLAPAVGVTWDPRYNKYAHDFTLEEANRIERRYGFLQRFTKVLSEAGVRLLLGSDAGNPGEVPGVSTHQELVRLVESGLTPYQALRTGTSDAGAFLFGDSGPGVAAPGRPADLLLVQGNPFTDVTAVANVRGLVLGGRWIPREELEARAQELLAAYAAERPFFARVDIDGMGRADELYRQRKAEDPEALVFRAEGLGALIGMYLHLGALEPALHAAELYVEEYPDAWRAYALMAEALAASGETELAAEVYEQALELDPGNARVRDARDALR